MRIDEIDVVEINEAFASVVMAWLLETHCDPARVNPCAAPSRSAIRWARPARG